MDYTTLAAVKQAMNSTDASADAALAEFITRASRAIDVYCTGQPGAADYFGHATVANEILDAIADGDGNLLCWPHRCVVNSVSAMSYRCRPDMEWESIDLEYIECSGGMVKAWAGIGLRDALKVKMGYDGGFTILPADLVEASTILSVRFFKESRSGLTDMIGLADGSSTFMYTKAWPVRIVEMLAPYRRIMGW